MTDNVKCKKCREIVFSSVQVVNCHGEAVKSNKPKSEDRKGSCEVQLSNSDDSPSDQSNRCVPSCDVTSEESVCESSEKLLYVSEQNLPDWMSSKINQAEWVKGKLHCPKCSCRLGSFNFVSGSKCLCGKSVLPAVHIVRAKVDFLQKMRTLTPD